MADRKVYHVVPHSGPEPGWDVEREGTKDGHDHYNTKDEAIKRGRHLAKPAKGQLMVHKRDGTIQTEYTYGNDPAGRPS